MHVAEFVRHLVGVLRPVSLACVQFHDHFTPVVAPEERDRAFGPADDDDVLGRQFRAELLELAHRRKAHLGDVRFAGLEAVGLHPDRAAARGEVGGGGPGRDGEQE